MCEYFAPSGWDPAMLWGLRIGRGDFFQLGTRLLMDHKFTQVGDDLKSVKTMVYFVMMMIQSAPLESSIFWQSNFGSDLMDGAWIKRNNKVLLDYLEPVSIWGQGQAAAMISTWVGDMIDLLRVLDKSTPKQSWTCYRGRVQYKQIPTKRRIGSQMILEGEVHSTEVRQVEFVAVPLGRWRWRMLRRKMCNKML